MKKNSFRVIAKAIFRDIISQIRDIILISKNICSIIYISFERRKQNGSIL